MEQNYERCQPEMSLMEMIAQDAAEEAARMQRALELARAARRAGELDTRRRAEVRARIIRENADVDPQDVAIAVEEASREQILDQDAG
ncbi:hypothetical protein [Leekyejoonella antrihumi]|uniref:Uncharacterized protein n=1 Tax=Leekyejoonella antrihumi TaxID=1660198 RepID=A0A563DW37_9MICO|nr:hypothetical protein [Leekyejoonella antrihumi]TWP34416.1 hypothetical protein FGL98_17760 [Leekyejoonella antrihumi]